MGTTVDNTHVFVGADGPTQDDVLAVVSGPAFITPAVDGWITVYPDGERLGDDALAVELSTRLDRPCVVFACFDSDVVDAALVVSGVVVGRLQSWSPLMFDEGAVPAGRPVPGVDLSLGVWGDLDIWVDALGVGEPAEIVAALNDLGGGEPVDISDLDDLGDEDDGLLAEDVAAALLSDFGLEPLRLFSAYRFVARGDDPADTSGYLRRS